MKHAQNSYICCKTSTVIHKSDKHPSGNCGGSVLVLLSCLFLLLFGVVGSGGNIL